MTGCKLAKPTDAMSDTEAGPSTSKSYEQRVAACSVIARPLASKKSTKKLYRLVKKAAKAKFVRRGVKEVIKGMKKGEKGLCLIAGDISPIDVISHLPVLCEESDIPYIYVPSKADLGAAGSTKRPTSCVLISPKSGFGEQDSYDALVKEVISVAPKFT